MVAALLLFTTDSFATLLIHDTFIWSQCVSCLAIGIHFARLVSSKATWQHLTDSRTVVYSHTITIMSTFLSSRQTQADDPWANFKLWHYTPSMAASVIFIILFTVLTAYHSYLLTRRRTWFCIPFVVGGIFEVIGYIARAAAHNATESVPIYAMQNLGLLLAPILFAASVYMILGRIIRAVHGEEYSLIRVNWLTKVFVAGDIFCFMLQGTGGGMLAGARTQSQVNLCNNIVLGGLILQIVIFGVFVAAAVVFQMRMSRRPTGAAVEGALGMNSRVGAVGQWTPARGLAGWKRLMLGLYLTSALITLRNLFRVIEYGMGWNSYLLSREWPLLVFDAALMVAVLVFGVVWYDPAISKRKVGNGKAGDEVGMVESGNGDGRGGSRGENGGEGRGVGAGPWS